MNRISTWENVGTATLSQDYHQVLSEADLNYKAVAEDLFVEHEGTKLQVPGRKVILREDTQEIFGIVSDRYQLCQNEEAFDFIENIDNIKLIRAGSAGGNVWIIGALPEVSVLGDTITPHLIFY